ncbi:MAG: cupin domain-containing protein [Gammaproteobacteria bacterium]|nr:cupin domain-containing protein [Gammaproteobacteria bacterium]
MLRPVRRVVTGHDDRGRSIIVSDEVSPHTRENPLQPGRGLTDLWRTFGSPPSNEGAADAAATEVVLSPPAGGSVFRFFQILPERLQAKMSPEERQRVADAVFSGMGASHNRDRHARHPGMHTTETLDYIILLSGDVSLLLDEGEVRLKPFDVVIQRGTNHSWVNHGEEPALLAGVLIDAVPLNR